MTPTPSSPAATGMDETAGIATSPRAARSECPELVAEEATTPLLVRVESVPDLPTAVGKAPSADPRQDPDPDEETWAPTTTWNSAQTPTHPAAVDPRMVDDLYPRPKDQGGRPPGEGPPGEPPYRGPLDRGLPGGPPGGDRADEPPGADIPEKIWR